MGVTGLWKLIEPSGKPVPVETLEGKVLAVDISIWLHQVVKGFQDHKGAALNNAHLLGLFHRLCKLLYYRVKPVFVFDGCVPQLKRDTIVRRQQQRNKLSNEADRIQNLLLQSLAKEKVVQMALGSNAELLLTSPAKKKVQNKDALVDDMFRLPELPESSKKAISSGNDDSKDDSFEDSFYSTEDYSTTSASDSSHEEPNPRNAYSSNLQSIDVRSSDFKQLPADVRRDILVDIKETRKQSSWGRLHELPSHSDDFSTFQMKRLLKRRQVQVSLEEAEKEMGNDKALTYTELTTIFTEEGILESETLKKGSKQISSSENTRYVLVRDLKKKIQTTSIVEEKIEGAKQEPQSKQSRREDDLPSTSKSLNDSDEKTMKNDLLGNEYDADLELAIALSLGDKADKVYNEKDYDYDSDETLKLSKDQRKQLQNTAKGPAAAYMIEYAGMNKEEVNGIMEKTQMDDRDFDDSLSIEQLIGDVGSSLIVKPHNNEPKVAKYEYKEIYLRLSDESDNTDSDLEEVEEENPKPVMSIMVELNKVPPPEDDLFADVFNEDECVIQETPEIKPMHSDQREKIPIYVNMKFKQDKFINETDDLVGNGLSCEKKDQLLEKQEDECAIEETPPTVQKEESNEFQLKTKEPGQSSSNNSEILLILDDLKKQANDVKNINLESIKLQNPIVEISDDELLPLEFVKDEIIEICDSDDGGRPSTPPAVTQAQQSPKNCSKSPKLKTPSKNHSITEFFNLNYVVKRTPDKPQPEEDQITPKVQSPFFVKKTPGSGCKSGNNSPPTSNKISKASKTLFGQNVKYSATSNADALDGGIEALPIQETITEVDVVKEAAELLKSNKTTSELNNLAANLAKGSRDLETERNRQDRMGMSITQRMNSDCQELLRLFGVPFIVAPMEAEAQCAFLDIVQLTNGTITDDSDIWLFGGRTVYKNFFAQNKHVMEFRSDQIEKNFNCDRRKLIQLACLVGSDYTTGK